MGLIFKKQITIIFGIFLLLSCFWPENVAGAEDTLLRNILDQVYPQYQVTMTSEKNADLHKGEITLPVKLEAVTEFDYDGKRYLAMVVVFKEFQLNLQKRFKQGEKIDIPQPHQNQLVLYRFNNPTNLCKVTIDKHAFGTARHQITISDMIGDGAQQLIIKAASMYSLEEPHELVAAERIYLYTLPALRNILASTSKRCVIGEKGMRAIEKFDIDFILGKSGKRVLRIRKQKDGIARLIERSEDGSFDLKDIKQNLSTRWASVRKVFTFDLQIAKDMVKSGGFVLKTEVEATIFKDIFGFVMPFKQMSQTVSLLIQRKERNKEKK